MNTKEFAQKILNTDQNNPLKFEKTLDQYSQDLSEDFIYEFSKNQKEKLSQNEIEDIHKILKKIEPDYLAKFKNLEIESTGHIHKITYNYAYPNTNHILFFNDEILLKFEESYNGKYLLSFFPLHEGIYFIYDELFGRKEKNPHENLDYKIKLSLDPKYKHINYFIYILEKLISFESFTTYHPNEQFYRNLLKRVFATILLDKYNPYESLQDEINKIKDILQKKEYPYNRERIVDLKDTYSLIKSL